MVRRKMSTAHKVKFLRILVAFILFGFIALPTHATNTQDCSCGAPCYVLLDYDNIFGIEDFVACLTIEGGPDLVVEDSANVTLTAGESISLIGGFAVNHNATFSLEIDPLLFCDVTLDLDEDLADACLDCNDDNSEVYPGAADICDGLDNDCDALIDENASVICNDGNSCTDDTCGGVNGCASVADNTNTCSDGDSCTNFDTCNNGVCAGTPLVDGYENNDAPDEASFLGEINDDAAYPAGTASASLYGPGDVDWYKYHVTDTVSGSLQPKLDLTSIPTSSNYTLCAYFECDDPGTRPSLSCNEGNTVSYAGLPGCCSTKTGSSSESVSFTMDCDNGIFTGDNNGLVYVRVYNAASTWSCSNYTLSWGDD